jgi:hypothetical protein
MIRKFFLLRRHCSHGVLPGFVCSRFCAGEAADRRREGRSRMVAMVTDLPKSSNVFAVHDSHWLNGS